MRTLHTLLYSAVLGLSCLSPVMATEFCEDAGGGPGEPTPADPGEGKCYQNFHYSASLGTPLWNDDDIRVKTVPADSTDKLIIDICNGTTQASSNRSSRQYLGLAEISFTSNLEEGLGHILQVGKTVVLGSSYVLLDWFATDASTARGATDPFDLQRQHLNSEIIGPLSDCSGTSSPTPVSIYLDNRISVSYAIGADVLPKYRTYFFTLATRPYTVSAVRAGTIASENMGSVDVKMSWSGLR